MKISSMNRKKRIDLSLIKRLRIEDFFSNFDISMLVYAGAEVLPIARPFIYK